MSVPSAGRAQRAYARGRTEFVHTWWLVLLLGLWATACTGGGPPTTATTEQADGHTVVDLPPARARGDVSLEETLAGRRSQREFTDEGATLADVAQLLWAAQGRTADWGGRAAPSAGALYPLEVYLVAGRVVHLDPGIYHYRSASHDLIRVAAGDRRAELAAASLDQSAVAQAPLALVISAAYARTTAKYGDRGIRYVHLEAGHAAQNVCLEAVALGLGSVPVGAFSDEEVRSVVQMPADETPLYVIPAGHPFPRTAP